MSASFCTSVTVTWKLVSFILILFHIWRLFLLHFSLGTFQKKYYVSFCCISQNPFFFNVSPSFITLIKICHAKKSLTVTYHNGRAFRLMRVFMPQSVPRYPTNVFGRLPLLFVFLQIKPPQFESCFSQFHKFLRHHTHLCVSFFHFPHFSPFGDSWRKLRVYSTGVFFACLNKGVFGMI